MDERARQTFEMQKAELRKQKLADEFVELAKQWERNYARLIRALADEYGEEEVLDIAEKTFWDQAYEIGLTWREKFETDPAGALAEKASSWHDSALWARICCCDVPVLEKDRWELISVKCYREVFRELGEPKIGISWCMTDFAAVRGWAPNVVMRQPHNMLRGDAYCQQIRYFTDDPSEQWDYSKETSEKVGWRSIKKLEE